MPENTILFLDARDDLATTKTLCRLIHASGLSTPIVLVLTEGGFTVVNSQWGIADVVVAPLPGRSRRPLDWSPSAATLPQPPTTSSCAESTTTVEDGQIRYGTSLWTPTAIPPPCMDAPSIWRTEFELLKYWSSTQPGVHAASVAAGSMGLRLLRWHSYGRRALSVVCTPTRRRIRTPLSAPSATLTIDRPAGDGWELPRTQAAESILCRHRHR